ncbi:hydantoinase/oxoprolinase N-terminal domain-containing protein [Cloacibacillus porcorum]
MAAIENIHEKKGILGIDAGGTFTDLVFWSEADGTAIASAKTPTMHSDLAGTIENGLKLILAEVNPEQIKAFNLATTLATNAIVENKLRPSALVIIGYDQDIAEKYSHEKKFGTDLVYQIRGGHDPKGSEAAPFDEAAFCEICDAMLPEIETVAVSSFFSVRNPAHEIRAREIIRTKRPDIHVTCGHELATELDALKRATTAALNAGLIPIIIELLNSVEDVCARLGINVPIMVVRSDGSLVSMDWARVHPIETVLSGPAASAIGACYLAKAAGFARGSCIVDIGGTTTDIIYLDEGGHPVIGTRGTTVGGHHTLVKSIDIFTFGLGGDSRVRFSKDKELLIGPRRVRSLCSAAADNSEVISCLKDILAEGTSQEPIVVFRGEKCRVSDSFEKRILSALGDRPSTVSRLLKDERLLNMGTIQLEEMEKRGLIQFAAFTPTDALVALGRLSKWDSCASELGARILAGGNLESVAGLCTLVCEKVSQLAVKNIFVKRLSTQGFDFARHNGAISLIDFALSSQTSLPPALLLKLNTELIGVGAPSWAFIPRIGEILSEEAIQPENAGVAGAVGAAVGTFFLRYSVLITPLAADGGYRAHLPVGIKDFEHLDEAVSHTVEALVPWVTERALNAGAKRPVVCHKREDTEALVAGGIRKIHLSTHIYFDVSEDLAK